jgi:hypothetical protein
MNKIQKLNLILNIILDHMHSKNLKFMAQKHKQDLEKRAINKLENEVKSNQEKLNNNFYE